MEKCRMLKIVTENISKKSVERYNRRNWRLSKYDSNIGTFIKCIQGEENRFNHVMIQMKAGLSV